MKRLSFKILTAAVVGGLAVFARYVAPLPAVVFHVEVAEYVELAVDLNIRNMVTAVYLGPRVLDTLLEALVVVLAVQGMFFVREGR